MSQDRVMLLIDADNVSIDIMEQAMQLLHKQHGGVHVRRAYCTAESAMKHQAAFKRMGIKPMVNLAAGKNSTDIALAVDAIDLVLAERPDVVVIASSDSDFAPLVQRLREKGCEVRGIGQLGKTGQETQDVYDDYTVLEHRKSAVPADAVPARKAARKTAAAKKAPAKKVGAPARKAAARKSAVKTATGEPARSAEAAEAAQAAASVESPEATRANAGIGDADSAPPAAKATRKRAARKTAAPAGAAAAPAAAVPALAPEPAPAAVAARESDRGSAPAPAPAPKSAPRSQGRASLDAVLGCLPELQSGQSLPLNTAARRLRDEQLLGQNSSSLKLFAAWPERFELVPPNQPSQVRLRRG